MTNELDVVLLDQPSSNYLPSKYRAASLGRLHDNSHLPLLDLLARPLLFDHDRVVVGEVSASAFDNELGFNR